MEYLKKDKPLLCEHTYVTDDDRSYCTFAERTVTEYDDCIDCECFLIYKKI